MTREELITLGEHKVRRDERLMLSYLQEFEKLFGRKPQCAGCTFKTDWKKFASNNQSIIKKFTPMETKTFKLKLSQNDVIHSYRNENRTIRTYGYKMTETFARAYLTNGTDEQIEKRKKLFDVLPELEKKPTIVVDGEEVFLSKATGKQLNAYAKENDIDFGDAKRVADKREVIAKLLQ